MNDNDPLCIGIMIKLNQNDTFYDLVKNGLDINCELGAEKTSPLMIACLAGNKEIVEFLIKSGANINAKDTNGYNVLCRACTCDDIEIIKILINAGADVNCDNTCYLTPLIISSLKCSIFAVSILLAAGADANGTNYKNVTPLISTMALCNDRGITNEKIIDTMKILINHGADVNKQMNMGETALIYASKFCTTEIIEFLLSCGADKTICTKSGYNLLIVSIMHENEETAIGIMGLGVDIFHKNNEKMNALMYACVYNMKNVAKILIERMTIIDPNSINDKCDNNFTALMIACNNSNEEIALLLIDAGADKYAHNKYNENAFYYAKKNKLYNVIARFDQVELYNEPRRCAFCRAVSTKNTVIILEYKCPICFETCPKIITFGCGHINCCKDCWGDMLPPNPDCLS